jgi:methylisocitrate lyase
MMPGSFNGLVGRMASDLGYQATYLSGAALTASRGVPDIGLLSLESFT